MNDYIDKLNNLPSDIKSLAISDTPMLEIKKAFVFFNIDSGLSSEIASEIGLIFTGDFLLENLPSLIQQKIKVNSTVAFGIAYEINKRLYYKFPQYFKSAGTLQEQWQKQKASPFITDENIAYQKVLQNEPWINELINEQKNLEARLRDEEKKASANFVKLALKEALKQYPEINDQVITASPLKLKNNPSLVAPSIKNWISDYTFNLGFQGHDSMARGNYLFQNENAKKLNTADRQKLSLILKSYDENTSLVINAAAKEIMFNQTTIASGSELQQAAAQPKSFIPPAASPGNVVNLAAKSPGASQKYAVFTPNYIDSHMQSQNSPKESGMRSGFFSPNNPPLSASHELSAPHTAQPASPAQPKPSGITFSSPQKLPSENKPFSPYRIGSFPDLKNSPAPDKKSTPPGNVVNLKEF